MSRKTALIALLVFLLSFMALTAGCSPTQIPLPPNEANISNNNLNKSEEPDRKDQIAADTNLEIMDEASGEKLRTHICDDTGKEIETLIEYQNEDKGHIWLRSNGTADRATVTNNEGKLLIEYSFADDGMTIASGKEFRSNGTIKQVIETQADSSRKITTYWHSNDSTTDAQNVFSIVICQPDNSFEVSYYHPEGKIWSKKFGINLGRKYPHTYYQEFDPQTEIKEETYFNKRGQIIFVDRVLSGDLHQKVFYRINGTISHTQNYVWLCKNGGNFKTLTQIERYDAEGKNVIEKIIMSKPTESLAEAKPSEIYYPTNSDGSVSVKHINSDDKVESVEQLDASGKRISLDEIPESQRTYAYIPYYTARLYDPLPYQIDLFLRWSQTEIDPIRMSIFNNCGIEFLRAEWDYEPY